MKAVRVVCLCFALCLALHAQCVMCQRTAAAQQTARAHVLNRGIAILLIPPFFAIGAILWMARRGSR